MYVSEQDRITKRKVDEEYINGEFQEALKCDPSLMIEQVLRRIVKKGWFKSTRTAEYYYNIYHETPATDGSAYQARYQASGSGKPEVVVAYLHGIINGVNHKRS